MKKVLMSMAVVVAMIAFASCGNNTKKADDKAAEATEQCCQDECCKPEGECAKEEGCCKDEAAATECPDCPAAESQKAE